MIEHNKLSKILDNYEENYQKKPSRKEYLKQYYQKLSPEQKEINKQRWKQHLYAIRKTK